MPESTSEIRLIANELVKNASERVTSIERALDHHTARDEAAHARTDARIQQIELALARAEGASLSRLLPWIALAVSAGGLAWNIARG